MAAQAAIHAYESKLMSFRARLPSIHINVQHPLNVMERLTKIAEISSVFSIVRDPLLSSSKHLIIGLRYNRPSEHKDLKAELVYCKTDNPCIGIEIRAQEWCPETPSYDVYLATAKKLVGPVLKQYNREQNSRYRLSVESKAELEPTLPPHALKYFDHFCNAANKENLHPSDWRRFYEFVRVSRKRMTEEEMARLLFKVGFSEENSFHIADIYAHLLDFQRTKTPAEVYEFLHVKQAK